MSRRLISPLLLALFVVICYSHTEVHALGPVAGTYDWIITIETEEQKEYFTYRGTALATVTRARASYQQGDAASADTTRYEDLWYSQGKPLGLERVHSLDLRPGDQIGIRIKHKTSRVPDYEAYAAANAVLRILMDAYLNGNQVTAVLAPADSFNSISQAFQKQGLSVPPPRDPEHPVQGSIVIQLVSEPEGSQETLVYSR